MPAAIEVVVRARSATAALKGRLASAWSALAVASLLAAPAALASPAGGAGELPPSPIAGAFVYPVGDELDYAKPHAGEKAGFYVSDPYLKTRGKRSRMRVHKGVDLANGRGGSVVRAIGSGTVVVAERNGLVKMKRKQRVKLPKVVNGERKYVWTTRYKSTWKWRTGWGNYVVVEHMLPSGELVYSLYAHLAPKSVKVKRGDVVAAGQEIAKVGRTGRASSSHLHLEIRKHLPRDGSAPDAGDESEEGLEAGETLEETSLNDEVGGAGSEAVDAQEVGGGDGTEARREPFARVPTIEPMTFLDQRVARFDDLEPGTWQARYALAASRDGLLFGDGRSFGPDDAISRREFYRAVATAFGISIPPPTEPFEMMVDALIAGGVLDPDASRSQRARDRIRSSDALEIVLRCLDRGSVIAYTLGSIDVADICRDFNRRFAGEEAAVLAERESVDRAAAETDALRQVALEKAKARSKGAKRLVRAPKVKPVKPEPALDPGFEALAKSKKNLTRAESCLLLASATRLGAETLSALQRASTHIAKSG